MSFFEEMKAATALMLQETSTAMNDVVLDLMSEAVVLSPTSAVGNYSKGVLINQWYSAIGDTPSSEVGSDADMQGTGSLSRLGSTLQQNPFLGKDNTVTFTNNTEQAYYADVLGWRKGMGTNGWMWTGNVGPYSMSANAVNFILGKYQ